MILLENSVIIIDNERASLDDKVHFEHTVTALLEKGAREIAVDLGRTVYLPTELMGFMMWKKKELAEQGIRFRIGRISASLKRIFDNAMLSDFFEINNTTEVID